MERGCFSNQRQETSKSFTIERRDTAANGEDGVNECDERKRKEREHESKREMKRERAMTGRIEDRRREERAKGAKKERWQGSSKRFGE